MVDKKQEFFVICDDIRSLENIGSIFRTAEALAVDKLFLCGISSQPPRWGFQKNPEGAPMLHPKIAKTALGAEKIVPFEYHKSISKLIDELHARGVQIIAL